LRRSLKLKRGKKMAIKKAQRNKKQAKKAPADTGSIWLAGVGAASMARKHSKALLGDLIAEGRRLQVEAIRFIRETRADAQAQVKGLLTPVKARLQTQAQKAGAAVETGVAVVRARLGIPSKADIDELSQRVGALSRQLKAAK
jgi:poly(hydroxyalkanoate) granule-associated protein